MTERTVDDNAAGSTCPCGKPWAECDSATLIGLLGDGARSTTDLGKLFAELFAGRGRSGHPMGTVELTGGTLGGASGLGRPRRVVMVSGASLSGLLSALGAGGSPLPESGPADEAAGATADDEPGAVSVV